MLIAKGGITRNIDEDRLHEYKAKGYEPVTGRKTAPRVPQGEKPLERMNTEELLAKAAELGMDISDATTNKQRVEAIQAFLADTDAGASADSNKTEE